MKASFKAILGTVAVVVFSAIAPIHAYTDIGDNVSSYQYDLKSDGVFRTNSMTAVEVTDYDSLPAYLNRAVIEEGLDDGCALYEVTINLSNIGNCDIEYELEDFYLGDTFDANGEESYNYGYNYKLYYDKDGRSSYTYTKYGRYIIPVGKAQDVKTYFLVDKQTKKLEVTVYSLRDESLSEDYKILVGTVEIP